MSNWSRSMNNENIPELLKKAINCWESIREAMDGAGIIDPNRMIPHLVVDAFLSGWRDGAISGRDHKIQVTRIYGARGADVFAEGVLSTKGDLIKIEGSRDLEITAPEAARLGKELIRLARINGWIDPEEDDGK
jgi:hypothetical protein